MKRLLVYALFGLITIVIPVGYYHKVSAGTCTTQGSVQFWKGYFHGGCAYNGSGPYGGNVETSLQTTRDINSFITAMKADIGNCSSTSENSIGAYYIVLTMMGKPERTSKNAICNNNNKLRDDWVTIVRQYDTAGQVNWWYCPGHPNYTLAQAGCGYSYNTNTFYSTNTGSGDVYTYSGQGTGTVPAIMFSNASGAPLYIIKHLCGNPVGTLKKLPTLTADISGKVYYYQTGFPKKVLSGVSVGFGGGISKNTDAQGKFAFNNTLVGTNFHIRVPDSFISGGKTYSKPVITPNQYGPPPTLKSPSGNSNCTLRSKSYENQTANTPSSGTSGCKYGLTDNSSYNIAYTLGTTSPPGTFTYNVAADVGVVSGTAENPIVISYKGTTSLTINGGSSCVKSENYKYTLDWIHANGNPPQNLDNQNTNPACLTATINPNLTKNVSGLPLQAGDQICLTVTVTPAKGKVDASGNPSMTSGTATDTDCLPIYNEPFFQVDHGSVFAGGEFADLGGCSQPGTLGGWFNNSGAFYGSGTQLAAIANGVAPNDVIQGFASGLGSFGSTVPPPKGAYVSFANGLVTNDDNDPTLGGAFDSTHCITSLQSPPTNPGSNPLTSASGGTHVYSASNLTIALTGTASGTTTIFVNNKDVYISKDIKYNVPAGGWAIGSVPSFKLVVKGGSIYIDPNVGELDGTYIAEDSNSTNKGQIFTCSKVVGPNFAPIDQASLFATCNKKQLAVFGSFIADKINLLRTQGSLRDMLNGKTGQVGSLCSNQGPPPTTITTCASEVFEYTPELFLSTPNGSTKFDAITTLPPIL